MLTPKPWTDLPVVMKFLMSPLGIVTVGACLLPLWREGVASDGLLVDVLGSRHLFLEIGPWGCSGLVGGGASWGLSSSTMILGTLLEPHSLLLFISGSGFSSLMPMASPYLSC